MIIFRDDDVGWTGLEPPDERFEKFQRLHELMKLNPRLFKHRVAVLAEFFKDQTAIDYIRKEISVGRIEAHVHGWRHIDYAKLSESEIELHLRATRDWIRDTLRFEATRFYSPWGADSPSIRRAVLRCGLQWVGAAGEIKPRHAVHALARQYPWDHLYGKEILIHWHNPRDRVDVKRIVAIYCHAGFTAAKNAHPHLFGTYEEALAHDSTI